MNLWSQFPSTYMINGQRVQTTQFFDYQIHLLRSVEDLTQQYIDWKQLILTLLHIKIYILNATIFFLLHHFHWSNNLTLLLWLGDKLIEYDKYRFISNGSSIFDRIKGLQHFEWDCDEMNFSRFQMNFELRFLCLNHSLHLLRRPFRVTASFSIVKLKFNKRSSRSNAVLSPL